MGVFRQLVDKKVIKILELLLKNKSQFFHLNKISRESNVSLATTFRIINRLVAMKVVAQTNIDKMKIYRIADNSQTIELINMLKADKK